MMEICLARTDGFLQEALFWKGCREIDSERLEKVTACKTAEDKARSLCCGLLLQHKLRCYRRTKKRVELRYRYGKYGKPYLRDDPALYFSLSHSGSFAVLVIADREVGADLQTVRPLRDGLVRRTLSEAEYKRYTQMVSPEEKRDWFFRCWCAKESYAKLTGEGLRKEFRLLSLHGDGRQIRPGAICREYRPWDPCFVNVCVHKTDGDPGFPESAMDITEQLYGLVGES